MAQLSAKSKRRSSGPIDGTHGKRIKPPVSENTTFTPFDSTSLPEPISVYANGAILRISVTNFLTYRHCSFYPGPWMNMVMGPNGSGKSSIVAAIALGLGASPAVLGRSKNIEEFVQYGQTSAQIEIVVKRDAFEDGLVVITRTLINKRMISNNSSHTEWKVNGQVVNHKHVKDLVSTMNINLDNLCQFLPQDKVSEFARLSPSELLTETERAVSGEGLYRQHMELIELQKQMVQLKTEQEADQRLLVNRQTITNQTESVLNAIKEREDQVRLMERCREKMVILEYEEMVDDLESKQAELKELTRTLSSAEQEMAPIEQRLAEIDKQLHSSKSVNNIKLRQQQLDSVIADLIASQEKQQNLKSELERIRVTVEKRKRDIQEHSRAINKLQGELEEEDCCPFDPNYLRSELKESMLARDAVVRDLADCEAQMERVKQEGDTITSKIVDYRRQLNRLRDDKERRLEAVRRIAPSVAQAYEWLCQNRDQFKDRVYGPMAVELGILKHASVVESLISRNLMTAFVFTNLEDERLFMSKFDRVGSVVVSNGNNNNSHNNSIDRGELKGLGFECLAIDCVEGEEPILRALCDQAAFDQTPIMSSSRSVLHIDHDLIGKRFRRYCIDQQVFNVRVNRYRPEERLVRCTLIRPAHLFTNTISQDEQQQATLIQSSINQLNQRLLENGNLVRPILLRQQDLQDKLSRLTADYQEITERRNQKKRQFEERERRKRVLADRQSELEQLLEHVKEDEHRQTSLLNEYDAILQSRQKQSLQACEVVCDYSNTFLDTLKTFGVKMVKWNAEKRELSKQLLEVQSSINQIKETIEEIKKVITKSQQECKLMADRLKAMGVTAQDAVLLKELQALPDTLADLTRLAAQAEARIERLENECIGVDLQKTKREQQERLMEIRTIQERTDRRSVVIQEKEEMIREQRQAWSSQIGPMITLISQRFGDLFADLHSVGQVDLVIPDENNLALAELAIMVSFHNSHSLHRLSASRQSGGEKSVSTILYLLALAGAHPHGTFTVVDEINQGMDAENERRVHHQILKAASGGRQYFLITPKLLPNLSYSEKMHVQCVLNY